MELKLNKFKQLFAEKELKKLIPEDERKGYLSRDNTIMVVPKYEEIKNILVNTFDVEERNVIVVDFNNKEVGYQAYNAELLKLIADLYKSNSDKIRFISAKDCPIHIDCEEMTIMLAPMFESD